MNDSINLPLSFTCSQKKETWQALITRLFNHGSHYEIQVQSRSSIIFIVGKYVTGGFVCIPAFNAGSELAGFSDFFWNCERLSLSINAVDAITVAQAIRTLYNGGYIK